jgi:thiamine kinase-like enzyme
MKIVKVTYTAKAEYAEHNQKNIKNVMADLQKLHHPGINYNSCLSADGKTFIHTAFFNSDEDEKVLLELPSFKYFQQQLKSSEPEVPPIQELLNLVGSSSSIFNA